MVDATDVRPLLEQCQGHDRIAFAELFERYHQRVFRSVYVIAPRSEAADDIMQLVFVELFAGAVAVSLILLAHVTHGVQNATQTVITMVKQIASGTSDSGTGNIARPQCDCTDRVPDGNGQPAVAPI